MNVLDVISPREDNKGKTRWIKVGVAFENDKGTRILLDAIPLPDKTGSVVLIVKERKNDDLQKKDET